MSKETIVSAMEVIDLEVIQSWVSLPGLFLKNLKFLRRSTSFGNVSYEHGNDWWWSKGIEISFYLYRFFFDIINLDKGRQQARRLSQMYNNMDDVLTKSRHSFAIAKDHRQTPAYKWLHFFHKWFKPVFAEFVATFILLFWACMLQPKPGAELSAMYQVSFK